MLTIGWTQREPPLAIAGVVLEGAAVSTYAGLLAQRIAAIDDLRVVIGSRYLIALSGADALPWIDNAIWLGMDEGLLCPTHLAPDLPSGLVCKAVIRKQPNCGVVVATPDLIIAAPMPARPPSVAKLRAVESAVERGIE